MLNFVYKTRKIITAKATLPTHQQPANKMNFFLLFFVLIIINKILIITIFIKAILLG